MKKYLTIIIIAVLVILPTVFAVKNYFDEKNAPPTDKSIIAVTLVDSNGKTYKFTKDDTTGEFLALINYFLQINNTASSISHLPENIADTTPFKIILHTAVKDQTYQYYLSSNAALCYIIDPKGDAFKMSEDSVKDFLQTKYTESLYDSASRPKLTLSGEHEVAPMESRWEYKANSSDFITADTSNVITSAVQRFYSMSKFTLEFDIVPDLCSVTITTSDGVELFNNTLDQLGDITVEQQTDVTVDITASWNEDPSRDYKGENKYSFLTTLNAPMAFFAVKSEAKQGDFIAITAKNTVDPAKITFKCEPAINMTPVFYSEGNGSPYAHALLAIPLNTEPGDYVITLTYGNTPQVLPLKVIDRATNQSSIKNIVLSADVYNTVCSDEAVKEFNNLVKSLTSNSSDKRMFEGSFYCYAPSGNVPATPFSYSYGYNKPLTINGTSAGSSPRVCYKAEAGTDVPAMNSGKVVYAGNLAHTGNIVVVDHGIGLMSWYYGMKTVNVSVGDEVKKGDAVGVVGQTGLMESNIYGVNIAMTVGDTFVSFYPLCTAEEDKCDGGILMHGVLDPANTSPAE